MFSKFRELVSWAPVEPSPQLQSQVAAVIEVVSEQVQEEICPRISIADIRSGSRAISSLSVDEMKTCLSYVGLETDGDRAELSMRLRNIIKVMRGVEKKPDQVRTLEALENRIKASKISFQDYRRLQSKLKQGVQGVSDPLDLESSDEEEDKPSMFSSSSRSVKRFMEPNVPRDPRLRGNGQVDTPYPKPAKRFMDRQPFVAPTPRARDTLEPFHTPNAMVRSPPATSYVSKAWSSTPLVPNHRRNSIAWSKRSSSQPSDQQDSKRRKQNQEDVAKLIMQTLDKMSTPLEDNKRKNQAWVTPSVATSSAKWPRFSKTESDEPPMPTSSMQMAPKIGRQANLETKSIATPVVVSFRPPVKTDAPPAPPPPPVKLSPSKNETTKKIAEPVPRKTCTTNFRYIFTPPLAIPHNSLLATPSLESMKPFKFGDTRSSDTYQVSPPASGPSDVFAKFMMDQDKWKCPSCMVKNDNKLEICPCCETPKPPSEPPASTTREDEPVSDVFAKFLMKQGKWKCPSCMVKNNDDLKECPCCETPNPNFNQKVENPPLFSFGEKKSDPFSVAAKESDTKPAFSVTPEETQASPFTFEGKKSEQAETKAAFLFGEKKLDAKPSFSFGAKVPESGSNEAPSFSFGDKKPEEVETKPTFSFGKTKSESKPAFKFGEMETEPKPAFKFGENEPDLKSESNGMPAFAFGENKSGDTKATFSFGGDGKKEDNDEKKPAFTFGKETKKETTAFTFGEKTEQEPESKPKSTKPFSFGEKSEEKKDEPSLKFGGEVQPEDSKPGFSFGRPKEDEPKPFNFGDKAPPPSFQPSATVPNPFSSKSNETTTSFAFGESKPVPSFGATSSTPAFGASSSRPPSFGAPADFKPEAPAASPFGNSTPAFGGTPTINNPAPNFGGSVAPPSFGASTPTISFGQAKQSFNADSFGGSNSTRVNTPTPFGNNSASPVPFTGGNQNNAPSFGLANSGGFPPQNNTIAPSFGQANSGGFPPQSNTTQSNPFAKGAPFAAAQQQPFAAAQQQPFAAAQQQPFANNAAPNPFGGGGFGNQQPGGFNAGGAFSIGMPTAAPGARKVVRAKRRVNR